MRCSILTGEVEQARPRGLELVVLLVLPGGGPLPAVGGGGHAAGDVVVVCGGGRAEGCGARLEQVARRTQELAGRPAPVLSHAAAAAEG